MLSKVFRARLRALLCYLELSREGEREMEEYDGFMADLEQVIRSSEEAKAVQGSLSSKMDIKICFEQIKKRYCLVPARIFDQSMDDEKRFAPFVASTM